jgi:hypothetical protein
LATTPALAIGLVAAVLTLGGCETIDWQQYDYDRTEGCSSQVGDPMGCDRGAPEPLCPVDAKTCEDLQRTEHVGDRKPE